jgi:L-threonylcarbamoyladenylate synthase
VIVPVDEAFDSSVDVLRHGGVIAVPTDTVYGLVALPADEAAMRRVFALKGRSEAKSVAVLVADVDQARPLSADPLDRVAPWWPGPVTVVVRRAPGVVLHLGGSGDTVGLRCPDHAFVRRLARELGPLAATSANIAGGPTPCTAAGVAAAFPDLTLVVDGGPVPGTASTVVDLTVRPPRVLREGPVTTVELGLGPLD